MVSEGHHHVLGKNYVLYRICVARARIELADEIMHVEHEVVMRYDQV
jgi:hypothetical protein